MSILEIIDLEVQYGGVRVLRGVSLSIEEGEIVTLIGANGAGKTTLLLAVSGLVPPSAGVIRYRGQALLKVPAHEIARRGLVHVPEGRIIFGDLTVQENLDLAGWWRKDRPSRIDDVDRVFAMFTRLDESRMMAGATLFCGNTQM